MTDEDVDGPGADGPVTDGAPASDAEDGEEWRFSVGEVGEDATEASGDADAGDRESNGEDGNVSGSLLDLDSELKPGTPTLEGTVFVLLGALATVLFLLKAGGVL